jgi:hypothetical protein
VQDDPALLESLRVPGLRAVAVAQTLAGLERRIAKPEAALARRG